MTDGQDHIRRDYCPCCPMLIGVYMYERPADLEQQKKRVRNKPVCDNTNKMKDVFKEDTSVRKYAQCDQWLPFNFKVSITCLDITKIFSVKL